MADVADDAQNYSLSWYQTMVPVRQAMLNLLAAGLFHLTEQQLAESCRDVAFHVDGPKTRLEKIKDWYSANFHLKLETLPSWETVDELRLVANAVKHGDGSASRQLKQRRPELFSNPDYAEIYKESEQYGMGPPMSEALAPRSGQDLFVSEKLLKAYVEGAAELFEEIAKYFASHGGQFFPY